jgi:Holliday junction resolvase RusA-like endonuclease
MLAELIPAPTQTSSLTMFVPGIPQPGGSKRAFTRPGMRFPVVTDANPKAKEWKSVVTSFAAQAAGTAPLMVGPLSVNVTFYLRRPDGHYGTGRNAGQLKTSAPAYPTCKPDATKLWRSTEDALTNVVFKDDSQIVQQSIGKRYCDGDQKPGAAIEIRSMT